MNRNPDVSSTIISQINNQLPVSGSDREYVELKKLLTRQSIFMGAATCAYLMGVTVLLLDRKK